MTEATAIKGQESKSLINLSPTKLNADEISRLVRSEKILEMEAKYPHLKNCIFACGGTCIVYYADNRKYLVKQLYKDTIDEDYLKKIREINENMAAYYLEKESNYFLRQIWAGEENKVYYEVFVATNGSTIGSSPLENVNDFITLFKEYRGFLKSLSALHEVGYVHFDVKPDNIFKYRANEGDSYTMQLFDFGSARLIDDVVKNLQSDDGEGFIYEVTPGWYDHHDIDKYCQAIKIDDSISKVLDLTAAVKVLVELVCGNPDGLSVGFDASMISSGFLGVKQKLSDIYHKAMNKDFSKRYVNCQDLMTDIDIIIESLEGNIKEPEALRLIAKNTLGDNADDLKCVDKFVMDSKKLYYKEHNESATIEKMLDDINLDILPFIKVDDKEYAHFDSDDERGSLSNDRSSPLELYLTENRRESKNLLLFGNGGGGKSTTLKHLYLKSQLFKKGKNVYLYLSGKDFKETPNRNNILSILNYRYHNCNIRKMVESRKNNLIILFDALDEIPSDIENDVYSEIEKLSAYKNLFIMTSREKPNLALGLSNVTEGEFCPLSDKQIENVAPHAFNEKNDKLLELLKNPMLMSIYLKLNRQAKNRKIQCAEHLIDEYLKKIYYSVHPNGEDLLFRHDILEIAKYCVYKITNAEEILAAKKLVKNGKLEHIIRFQEYTRTVKNNGSNEASEIKYHKAVFTHKLYEDFFKGVWLYDFFTRAIREEDFTISRFYFNNLVKLEKNLTPYFANKIRNELIKLYAADSKSNDEMTNVYNAINSFISHFERADVKKRFANERKNQKHLKAIKNIVNLIVLCCDGCMVDIEKNKPLVDLGCFSKIFFDVVNFEKVNSAYVPWYINVNSQMKSLNNSKSSIALQVNTGAEGSGDDREQDVNFDCILYSKHLVVSKWNLSCKSEKGSLYSKWGNKLICATRANINENGEESYEISKNVSAISKTAFKYCVCEEFTANDNKRFSTKDGVLYENKTRTLIKYPVKKAVSRFKLIEAENVYPYAFANAKMLKSVDLADLKSKALPTSLFEGSTVENVDLPDSISCIGERAFCDCRQLTSLSISGSDVSTNATRILDKAFYGCTRLTKFIVPKNVNYIGKLALAETKSLEDLLINPSCAYIADDSFKNSSANQQKSPEADRFEFAHAPIRRNDLVKSNEEIRIFMESRRFNEETKYLFKSIHYFDHGEYKKFFKLTKKSYNKGKTYANVYNLAVCYALGIGTAVDLRKAELLQNRLESVEGEIEL